MNHTRADQRGDLRVIALTTLLVIASAGLARGQSRTDLTQEAGRRLRTADLLGRPAHLLLKDAALASGLSELQETSGVSLAFSPSLLPQHPRVSCFCESVSVRQALDHLLQQFDLRYEQVDGIIVILPRAQPVPLLAEPVRGTEVLSAATDPSHRLLFLTRSSVQDLVASQDRVLTGRVMDSVRSEPLTSGRVSIRGSLAGADLKPDGTFSLTIPAGEVVLLVRSIGYKPKTLTIGPTQTSITISLARDYLQLEALVVTGQATGIERRNLANAVSTVNGEDMVKVPSTTVEQALYGKVPGANIMSTSGAPGGGVQVHLRGISSIIGEQSPLYVVDGVIVSNVAIPSGTNSILNATGRGDIASDQDQVVNRVADLNPNDIETVEVLKGASAAAIYGSKAANGVIIINTRRGRAGNSKFRLSQGLGYSEIAHRMGMRQFNSEAEAESAFGPNAAGVWQPGAFFDHENELFGQKPLSYETTASMTGGNANTQYLLSGLIKRDGGILVGTGYDKQSLRVNIDQSVGSRLRFSINTNGIHSVAARGFNNNDNVGVGMYVTIPFIPSFLDIRQRPDGTWPVTFPFAASNPLQTATLATNDEHVYRFIGSGRVTYNVFATARQSLQVVGIAGVDWFNQRNVIYSPPELQFEPLDGFAGTSVQSSSYSSQSNVTGSLVHTIRSATGAFSATTSVGAQYEVADLNIGRTRARGLIGGLSNVNRGLATDVGQTRSRAEDAGIFAQEEFLALHDRLLLTVGIRGDKSSNDGDPGKLFYYPKAAASYRIGLGGASNDELKLRVAYGQSGNRPLYSQKFTELSAGNLGGLPATQVDTVTGASNLRPERQREIEAGLDATLRGGRIGLELTGFDKQVDNLLLRRSLAPSAGFSTAILNGGTLRIRGVEAALTVVPIQSRRLQWMSRATFSLNRSKLLSLPVPPFNAGADAEAIRLEPGQSITQIYGNDTLPDGSVIFHKIGDQNPTFRLGWSNDLTYKGVNLYFLWDWQQGGAVLEDLTAWLFDLAHQSVDYTNPCVGSCLPGETLGDQRNRLWPAKVGRIWGAEDATYLKLREVTLTANLPESIAKHIWLHANDVRVSVSGRNLLRFTRFKGPDPEVSNGGFGGFGNIDITPYPPSRTFWFAINLGF